MATNEEIQEKHGKHPLGYHSKLGEYDSGDCQEVMLNEARSDTANKIFKELKEKFYVICKEVNVEGGYLNKSEFNDGCRNFREFERKWVD